MNTFRVSGISNCTDGLEDVRIKDLSKLEKYLRYCIVDESRWVKVTHERFEGVRFIIRI